MVDTTDEQWNFLNGFFKNKDNTTLMAPFVSYGQDDNYNLGRLLNSDEAKTLSDISGIPIDELNIEDIEAARPWYSFFSDVMDNIASNRLIQGDRIGENYARAFKHNFKDSNLDEATLAAIINASSGFRNSILDLIPEKDKRGFFSYLHNLGASTINKISGDEAAILGYYRKYLKENKPEKKTVNTEKVSKPKQESIDVVSDLFDSSVNKLPPYVQAASEPKTNDKAFERQKKIDEEILKQRDRSRAFGEKWRKQPNHAAWWLYK
jgi:hypothetical protein